MDIVEIVRLFLRWFRWSVCCFLVAAGVLYFLGWYVPEHPQLAQILALCISNSEDLAWPAFSICLLAAVLIALPTINRYWRLRHYGEPMCLNCGRALEQNAKGCEKCGWDFFSQI